MSDKEFKRVYGSIDQAIFSIASSSTKLTNVEYHKVSDFYKPSAITNILKKLDTERRPNTPAYKKILNNLSNNINALKQFYDNYQKAQLSIASTPVLTIEGKAKVTKYFEAITDSDKPEYAIIDEHKLIKAIDKLDTKYKKTAVTYGISGDVFNAYSFFGELVKLANKIDININETQPSKASPIIATDSPEEFKAVYMIVCETLGEMYERNKPVEQTNLFSNIAIGIDTAEITGRHQFFSPMFRGFMGLGESGLYSAINQANKRGNSVTIPYETKGSSSVYKTKLQTSVDISGVEKDLITDEAKAQRFTARLIKTQGILYLWAMHTNSLTIYNTKITDMLRLAGYEGRIKPEHYIDITEGIAGLFAIAVTKTDDHYTDPKTGKKVYVGKNEMYGEVVRPIGEVRAIWHKGTDGKPAYIKQLIRLEIAKGMLNPTARRATLVSKALLRLNTLQERQYLQLGSFISDLFSQYQDKTIKGEPVALTLQTLLEYRGLTDPDSLRRVEQTKTYLKQALDKLVEIGHIAKWTVKNSNYEKLTLTGRDLDTVILIYPTASVQEALKPVIIDDDKALTAILTQEVRTAGLATTAEHYGANAEVIEAVINNRDTADSLPNNAYNELKTKAYDSGKTGKKRQAN
jgi:hypothetical protein